jgi:ferrous iron transport protein B
MYYQTFLRKENDTMESKIVVALMGNPNSGKSTIFNELTGARQHVGNYPGVTVERKEAYRNYAGKQLKIVDLPGTYSLNAHSEEELIARNFLVNEKPDLVVDVIDASNLERNLYLATQIAEMGIPLILVFNMSDMAKARGFQFDLERLARDFGVPIIPTVGTKGQGIEELLKVIIANTGEKKTDTKVQESVLFSYHPAIEEEIGILSKHLEKIHAIRKQYPLRWLALKLLEKDKELSVKYASSDIQEQVKRSVAVIEQKMDQSVESAIASERYQWIAGLCQNAVKSSLAVGGKSWSEKIDAVVTNKFLGIPLFLGLMYMVFHLTFTLAGPLMDYIDSFFGWLGSSLSSIWPGSGDSLLLSLLNDGVIGGVGGVLIFLPNILLLFFALSLLEDSGYMARAAFIMDRIMHKLGLHGKSFIPLLLGFGCSIPAIMATRTLENRRDRLTTMLVVPLVSCGAKLPIYLLIIPAFFPAMWHAPMLWIIYVIGILLAILVAKLLRHTVLKGAPEPFVMELPPYRWPTLKSVGIHMWERGWLYIKKAGTIILSISILLWAISTFPMLPTNQAEVFEGARISIETSGAEESVLENQLAEVDYQEAQAALKHSIAGRIGHAMEPLIKPMGFDWRIGTALIGSFAAKEVFVAQMGIVYSIGEADESSDSLRDKLQSNYPPIVGFCIMLFCLISAPCMATFAILKRESNSWRWALFQLVGLTLLAYVLSVLVYQFGRLLGIGIG